MSQILSEEEINALLELFQTGTIPAVEIPAEKDSLVEHDLQRRFFRSTQRLHAALRVGGGTHRVMVTNISLGGVFVCAPLPVHIGQEVGLAIELPEPLARITVCGCVCWQKKTGAEVFGLGIRFSSLATEEIWAIVANIEQARKKSF